MKRDKRKVIKLKNGGEIYFAGANVPEIHGATSDGVLGYGIGKLCKPMKKKPNGKRCKY